MQQRHDDGVVGNGVVRNAFVSQQHDRGAEVLFVPIALDPAADVSTTMWWLLAALTNG